MIMIGDEADDDYGRMIGTSGATGGKSLYIVVDDVDELFAVLIEQGHNPTLELLVEGASVRGARPRRCATHGPPCDSLDVPLYPPAIENTEAGNPIQGCLHAAGA